MAESDLIRGNVDTVILKILFEGDRYGYEIIKQINARSGGQWEIKQPTLYACLKRLEKQGFIKSYWDSSESSGGGRRKYFSLTDRGREVFVTYRAEWERSRDLFGELITGDDGIYTGDDFSDIEEESYDVPKRRSRKKPRKVTEQPEPEEPVQPEEPTDEPPIELPPVDDNIDNYPPIELPPEEPQEQRQEREQLSDETAEQTDDGYIQQSFFDNNNDNGDSEHGDGQSDDVVSDETVDERADDGIIIGDDDYAPVPPRDPQTVLDEIYASTYTGADSYYHARGRTYDETYENGASEPQAQEQPPAPQDQDEQSPEPPVQPEHYDETPNDDNGAADAPIDDGESLARREYRSVLSELVDGLDEADDQDGQDAAAASDTADEYADDYAEEPETDADFGAVMRSVEELGNDVTVREHNDSAKIYTHRYKYYSNRLMLTQYTIVCALMFVMGLIMFLTCYVGLGMRMRYDNLLYIFTGLLPIVMFIIVVIIFIGEPDRKKNININFRSSIGIRVLMMLQIMVLFYCINLIWGMPVSFSVHYVPSVLIPFVYSIFVPLSKVIFMGLLKSGRYNAE